MYAEAKGDLLKRVSLLSACLAPIVKYVPAKVEVTQVRFCGAQGSPLIVRSLKKNKNRKKSPCVSRAYLCWGSRQGRWAKQVGRTGCCRGWCRRVCPQHGDVLVCKDSPLAGGQTARFFQRHPMDRLKVPHCMTPICASAARYGPACNQMRAST